MSTRSMVGVSTGAAYVARYIHFDGYPAWTGRQIAKIVHAHADNPEKLGEAVSFLLSHDWSSVDASADDGETRGSNTQVKPGFGFYFTDDPGQLMVGEISGASGMRVPFLYLIDLDSHAVHVHAFCHGSYELIGSITVTDDLDNEELFAKLGPTPA